jgi:putative endonuclease
MLQTLFYTYILRCADGTYYVGKTNDIEKRLQQHNGIKKGGAKYTRGRRPVQLQYIEQFETHKEAAQREVRLKLLTHKQKAETIQQSSVLEHSEVVTAA